MSFLYTSPEHVTALRLIQSGCCGRGQVTYYFIQVDYLNPCKSQYISEFIASNLSLTSFISAARLLGPVFLGLNIYASFSTFFLFLLTALKPLNCGRRQCSQRNTLFLALVWATLTSSLASQRSFQNEESSITVLAAFQPRAAGG